MKNIWLIIKVKYYKTPIGFRKYETHQRIILDLNNI